ncbi:MAG: EAL domain-containing protein [Lachnospiraceae bacterium]|nr:EAL domain-containing protein [Lachnospiraceae bacterium]
MEKYVFDEKAKALLESSCVPFAIYQFLDNRVVTHLVTDGFCDIMGVDRATVYDSMENHLYDADHPDDVARLGNAVIEFATGKSDFNILYRTKTPDGYHIIHARGKHVNAPTGEQLAVVWYSDEGLYTDDRKPFFDQAMEHMLLNNGSIQEVGYDNMTGLPNMNYFLKLAEKTRDDIIASGETPILLYFDFNDMKNYNLRYGFEEGDKLIVGLSRILSSHYSNINCSRLSGDHFVAVTSDKNLEQELYEVFEECKNLNGGRSLFVRVGIYKKEGETISVGIACDRAKLACDHRRNIAESSFTYFSEDLLKASQLRHYIIENLDKAIQEKWIQVYYQPIVRSVNERVSDEEALARWIDPIKGFMSPADFIPVLEDAKLLYKLDLYVLEQILERMKLFEEKGFFIVPCSINISRNDFDKIDVVEEIRRRVDDSGVGRDKITIEITESAVGEDIDYLSKQVDRLKSLGFSVWMDDYGTGYSSPDILQQIRFDTLKLDMTFMRSFDKTHKSRIIISELINMALNLNMEVVVEGVETEEQVRFLKEAGATKMQGYYFCKPVTVDAILERYEKGMQIGFENPMESDYFAAVGRFNLYNFSAFSGSDIQSDYFNTIPIAIFEVRDSDVTIIRCNHSYQKAARKFFGIDDIHVSVPFDAFNLEQKVNFLDFLLGCAEDGGQIIEELPVNKDYKANMLFRRVAVNSVTEVKAVALMLLDIKEKKKGIEALSFGSVAKALSSDYMHLYFVDLDTEEYTEYLPDRDRYDMSLERRGDHFFKNSRKDALKVLYKDDRERFIATFNRKTILKSIENEGGFSTIYRILQNGEPLYVNLKAVLTEDKKYLIIGVNDVDAQVREHQEMMRAEEDMTIFSRIRALSGSYIAFYTVDLDTEDYYLYDAAQDFTALVSGNFGSDFFATALRESEPVIDPKDFEHFRNNFNKAAILDAIDKTGLFSIKYHLKIGDEICEVCMKVAKLVEDGSDKLIIGVEKIGESIE